jgi:hypothetical protein
MAHEAGAYHQSKRAAMTPRSASLLLLLLLLLCGCSSDKNSGPRSGPGEQDPEKLRETHAVLAAEQLEGRYKAGVKRRADGKWEVSLLNAPFFDADLSALDQLEPLAVLNLSGTGVTDRGMVRIGKFIHLEHLNLMSTQVTTLGLEELKDLKELLLLAVGRATTDRAIPTLLLHSKLRVLALTHSAVTDDGLKELKRLQHLAGLSLSHTRVTDKGMPALNEIKSLRNVDLVRTGVGDEGAKHLAAHPALELVDLQQTRLTDEGLAELGKLRALKRLVVFGTKVTKPAVEAFRKAHPSVRVDH